MATPPNKPGGLLTDALSLAKHAAVGFRSPFESPGSTTFKRDTTPGIVRYAPALAAKLGYNTEPGHYVETGTRLRAPVMLEQFPVAAASLYNLGAGYLRDKGVNIAGYEPADIKGGYLDHMRNDVMAADKKTREAIGVGEPQNGFEVAAEIAGGLIAPGPKIGKVTQEITPGMKLGEKVLTHAANAGKQTAKLGAELLLPGRQGGLKTAVAATAIGTGASEAVDAVANDKDYTSVADAVKQVIRPELRQKEWGEYLDPATIAEYNKAVDEGDYEYANQVQELATQLQEKDKVESYLPDKPEWEQFGADALAFGALALGVWATHRTMKGAQLRIQNGSELAGKTFEDSYTPAGTKAVQGGIQADQSLREASKEMTGDKGRIFGESDALKQTKARLDGVSVASLQSKIKHFVATGQAPNSAVKVRPMGVLLESAAKDLDPPSRAMLTDGLLAKSALDDWKRTGQKVQFKYKPDGSEYTKSELQHMVNLVEADPKLKFYADETRRQYVAQLDYMLEKGRITKDQYDEFRVDRPNYVHMSKNTGDDVVAQFWGRGDKGQMAYNARDNLLRGRSEESGGGVRAGETADPLVDLPNQWAELIHHMEINDVKKSWLEAAHNNPELSKIIKRIPGGEKPKNLEGVHAVWDKGQEVHYKVDDASMAEALDFTPFTQRSALAAMMDTPRKLFQQGTTGIGNPLFAGTAATYDTVTGIMLRPKGYDLGIINEFMNKVSKGKVNIGAFDPTMWVSAPVGAVRYAKDSLVGAISTELATQVTRGSGLAYDMLGPQATQKLQVAFAKAYDNSIKSIMEEYGAGGSSPFLASLPDQIAPGMKDVAPQFATEAAKQAFADAVKGNAKTAELVLQGSKSLWEQGRASTLARLYTGTMKSIHEGFRYQGFATNYAKGLFSQDDMVLLASQTRRLAADIGQQGAGQLVQDITHSATYSNIAVQTLAELARKMKAQPITTMFNTVSAITGLAMLRYGALANDPAKREELRRLSDGQNSAHFKTFGDLTVNIPAELRVMTAPMFAVLDRMSGLYDVNPDGTDNFNPNLIQAVHSWIDGGMQSSEEMKLSVMESLKAGATAAMPINQSSFPAINAGMATMGVDVPFSRFTGDAQAIKPQQVSPLGGEGTLTNDAVTATWQHAISDVIGSGFWGYARAAMDYDRARKSGGDMSDGVKIAMSRLADQQASMSGPGPSMVYKGYDKVESVNTTDTRLYYMKRDGLDKVAAIMNKDILSMYTDSLNPRSAMLSQLSPMDLERKPELLGTALVPVGAISAQLMKSLKPIRDHLGQLQQQVTDIQNQTVDTPKQYQEAGGKQLSTIEERNRQINKINEERRYWIGVMLRQTQVTEDTIRQTINDPTFTFQDFDPEKYAKMPFNPGALAPGGPPMQASQPSVQPQP